MTRKRTMKPRWALVGASALGCLVAVVAAGADAPGPIAGPAATSSLELAAPIDQWDEAIPLGNGLTGGLLWGSGNRLNLSLDRGDLWDLRTPDTLLRDDWTWATIRKLVAEKNQARVSELFDVPYNAFPYPTKIPAGRLELTLDGSQTAQAFTLDLASAMARVKLGAGGVEVFYSAEEPVAMIRVAGPPCAWRIVAPDSLKQLGYGPPETGSQGEVSWAVHEAVLGLKYAVVTGGRRVGHSTEIAVAITSTHDGPDPRDVGGQGGQHEVRPRDHGEHSPPLTGDRGQAPVRRHEEQCAEQPRQDEGREDLVPVVVVHGPPPGTCVTSAFDPSMPSGCDTTGGGTAVPQAASGVPDPV